MSKKRIKVTCVVDGTVETDVINTKGHVSCKILDDGRGIIRAGKTMIIYRNTQRIRVDKR